MNAFLSATERRALRRAVHLLDLDQTRFIGSVATGALGLGSAIGLSAVAAWMIARACQVPDVVALGVAPVAVRLLGISRSVLRYCERLLSHDTALRGMTSLRTHLYEILSASRTDTVAGLHRGDVLARVGADVDAVGDLVVRCYLPMAVAAAVCTITSAALALVHPLAGLALAACLLLAGIIGPLVTLRAAQAAELARQEQATDLSATVLTTLEGGSELRVSARLPRVMDDLAALETHLASTRDRGARPAAAAAAVDVAAMGLAVVAGLLIGVPAVAGGMDPVWLAVIALVPLAAFEATSALGPASVQLVASAGAATRIVDLIDRAEASRADAPSPRPLPPITEGGPRLRARARRGRRHRSRPGTRRPTGHRRPVGSRQDDSPADPGRSPGAQGRRADARRSLPVDGEAGGRGPSDHSDRRGRPHLRHHGPGEPARGRRRPDPRSGARSAQARRPG